MDMRTLTTGAQQHIWEVLLSPWSYSKGNAPSSIVSVDGEWIERRHERKVALHAEKGSIGHFNKTYWTGRSETIPQFVQLCCGLWIFTTTSRDQSKSPSTCPSYR